MKVRKIVTSNELKTNTYIIDEKFVIDPGKNIGDYINNEIIVLLTHAHFDHIIGLAELKVKELYIHPLDVELLRDPQKNFSEYIGSPFSWQGEWKDITHSFNILHTPGHTPGSCIIHIENYLFTGDTLFFDSIGRTDLAGSSSEQMKKSLKTLKEYLLNLPEDTIIAPGHSRTAFLKDLLKVNPYMIFESSI